MLRVKSVEFNVNSLTMQVPFRGKTIKMRRWRRRRRRKNDKNEEVEEEEEERERVTRESLIPYIFLC